MVSFSRLLSVSYPFVGLCRLLSAFVGYFRPCGLLLDGGFLLKLSAFVGFCWLVGFSRLLSVLLAFVLFCWLLLAFVCFCQPLSAFVSFCELLLAFVGLCRNCWLSAFGGFCWFLFALVNFFGLLAFVGVVGFCWLWWAFVHFGRFMSVFVGLLLGFWGLLGASVSYCYCGFCWMVGLCRHYRLLSTFAGLC